MFPNKEDKTKEWYVCSNFDSLHKNSIQLCAEMKISE